MSTYRRGLLTAESTFRAVLNISSAVESDELGRDFSSRSLGPLFCLLADGRGAMTLTKRAFSPGDTNLTR
jgi:hypothetical protein